MKSKSTDEIKIQPRFETSSERKFAGKRMKMSFADNRTFELWREFMPHRDKFANRLGGELYSVEIYPEGFFENFDSAKEFEKWAASEVENFENLPDEMEFFTSPAGLYAVFICNGKASEATNFYQNIFGDWLPNSEFILDDRPHFAVMGEKYKNDSDDSEEEIWIPVKTK